MLAGGGGCCGENSLFLFAVGSHKRILCHITVMWGFYPLPLMYADLNDNLVFNITPNQPASKPPSQPFSQPKNYHHQVVEKIDLFFCSVRHLLPWLSSSLQWRKSSLLVGRKITKNNSSKTIIGFSVHVVLGFDRAHR